MECKYNKMEPTYNGNIEGDLSSERYNKAARCFQSVFKK